MEAYSARECAKSVHLRAQCAAALGFHCRAGNEGSCENEKSGADRRAGRDGDKTDNTRRPNQRGQSPAKTACIVRLSLPMSAMRLLHVATPKAEGERYPPATLRTATREPLSSTARRQDLTAATLAGGGVRSHNDTLSVETPPVHVRISSQIHAQ